MASHQTRARAREVNRSAFGFVFGAGLMGILSTLTGLIGYQPPGRIDLFDAWWRRGVWTGGVIWSQLVVGVALLLAAGFVARRVNRRLAAGR
jgi:hypothetical protein